ncbi:MAG: hypothetical protein HOJ22_05270 [Chloroflexi bacterium]|jgi:hypothetical protein|nr:hypothetical protein [Chloroflexota bacterium]MBT5627683.1 hypothetical protein [Chloroflexota bacterium]
MSNIIRTAALLKQSRWLFLALLFGALAMAMACGSGDDDSSADAAAPAAEEADDDLAEVSRILNPDKTYTADDYLAAGWKQSKQYDDISTVPEATEVYFGFFSAKDIELRVYASHDSAKTAGFTDAAEDIDQSFREGGQFGSSNRGAGSRAVTKFKAFAVVGNTVMLCEQSIDACLALSDALDG